ncbi:3-oxoacyl-ACP reductase [Actinoplanes lobatus]|uniref:3-oxoacyl-ACP reductase n=1 Tax=Actinoplanes lobatus TaxID=113568 RepID=A0A7W7HQV7_9ACTN|nr:oxidoreductase [Actinoplanes lobatus]MBB4755048.1 NAD(P)-dependent dehydrogenase (short-subunit alcohol dehydrogenase family) [Actinoplanes lobatus]GGN82349.1 3-oxoacyl-ACP reductase [Actinoplanes lobatus]GIE40635.1 3-oxoacyl-ACP reductase [Actinoplanes lobatus]
MNLNLAGKTAVVTGASKGIGLAITRALAGEGANVVAAARTAATATGSVYPVAVDLTTPGGPAALIEAAVARFGGVDILVNNVGAVRPRPDGFLSVTDDGWTSTFLVNFFSAVRTTRAVLPHLLSKGAGSIVTITSVNAVLPDPMVIDYSAAKAALASFCKSLSKEVGPHGIRVNTISPGPVSTDLWLGDDGVAAALSRVTGRPPQDIAASAAKDTVTGRFTRADEVAALVLLLAGDRAANVIGADFAIDGGMTTTL